MATPHAICSHASAIPTVCKGRVFVDELKIQLADSIILLDFRLQALNDLSDALENCQKSLSEYLDTKRCSFPRFYFISDDELLSILGTSDPTSVQEHMLKLFDNCAALRYGRGNKSVIGMTSSEKESFDFRAPVVIEGPVEGWMSNVEEEMRRTLFQISKEGVFYYAKMSRNKCVNARKLSMLSSLATSIHPWQCAHEGTSWSRNAFSIPATLQKRRCLFESRKG